VGDYLLRPSSAERWVNCPASVQLSAPYPEQDSEEAREGTEAHALAAEGLAAGAGWLPPATEMGYAVGEYVKRCQSAPGLKAWEELLPVATVHEQCGGTVDFRSIDWAQKVLYIKDLKYGFDPVEAFENWQTMLYAEAQIVRNALNDLEWQVDIEIYQPRCYQGRDTHTWRFPAHELRSYMNKAREAAVAALGPSPRAKSGPWCVYCPAVHACSTALKAGASLYEAAGRGMPHDMPAWALGVQLSIVSRALKQLETLYAAYTAELLSRSEAGENCGPWAVTIEEGRLQWLIDDDTVAAIAPHLCKLRPPTATQARDAGVSVTGLASRPKVRKLKALDLRRIFLPIYKSEK
jgi:hypothetical protein